VAAVLQSRAAAPEPLIPDTSEGLPRGPVVDQIKTRANPNHNEKTGTSGLDDGVHYTSHSILVGRVEVQSQNVLRGFGRKRRDIRPQDAIQG